MQCKSHERNEYSYIGVGDFCLFIFSGKCVKICSLSNLVFDFLSRHHFFKGMQTTLLNSKSKRHKNVIDFVSNVEFNFQIPSGIKISDFDSVFSNWENFINKFKNNLF